MIAVNNESGCWPTPNQELLLRAALLHGDEARAAWTEWTKRVNLDVLDYGSHRMIPQLYKNLLALDIVDDSMPRLKGVYRYYLYNNSILLHRMTAVLQKLNAAGIKTMALKGAALSTLYYSDRGLRPMEDVDVLVPTKQAAAAMNVLAGEHWTSTQFASPQSRIPILHSTPFQNGDGYQLDLHWHLLWECFNAANNEDYWSKAIPIKIGDVSTLSLSHTHQLLHTCWHGVRWNEVPPIRWVADANAILTVAQQQIDWDEIVSKARIHRINLALKDSLQYLRKLLAAPVPESVIKQLEAMPATKMDREAYAVSMNPLATKSTAQILQMLYYDYCWLRSSTSFKFKSLAFARFLQAKWHVNHLWQVPFYLSFRAFRRGMKDKESVPSVPVG